MIIWFWLVILAPGVFAALYFEYIMNLKNSVAKQVAIWICFSFFINLFVATAIWIRGHYGMNFELLDVSSPAFSLSFAVRYMGLATILAILLPWIAALFSTINRQTWDKYIKELPIAEKFRRRK